MRRRLDIAIEPWVLARPFAISRGIKREAVVVVATLVEGDHRGRGEATPYGRYGETPDSVVAAIEGARDLIESGVDREALQVALPAGAARNALDCALWDLDSKRLGLRASVLAGLHRVPPVTTAFTISLGSTAAMASAARAESWRPVLKVKLGGEDDDAAIAAVREAAPDATLTVDANEGWTTANLMARLEACRRADVALIEQPLPAGRDDALRALPVPRSVPICADESAHVRSDLPVLRERYDVVNVKLDKAGGLTEALKLVDEAERLGLGVMVGCMASTSLGVAPALLLAPRARFVDLDGPLLLARDRDPGLRYEGSVVHPPDAALWG